MIRTVLLALAASAVSAACDTDAQSKCGAQCAVDNGMDVCKLMQCVLDCATSAKCVDKESCDEFNKQMEDSTFADCDIVCKASCFPFDAQVQLEGGMTKKIGELMIGDKVHVGSNKFSEVYYFSTELQETSSKFLQIATSDNTLMLTSGHFLYVNGVLAEARTAKVGDELTLADGSTAVIEKITSAWAPGLYNPHTLDGDIVVDGILTSTYTDAVHPTLAHALLAPLRQLYSAGLITFSKPFGDFTKGLPSWILDAIKA